MTAMRSEVEEQPAALERTLAALRPAVPELRQVARDCRQVLLVARRSSDNAAVYGSYVCSVRGGRLATLASPSVATAYGARVDLTARELAVLEILLWRPRVLTSKELLFESLYTWDSEANISAIEVYISRLRKKLEPAGVAIRMFRGLGYRLEAHDAASTA